MSTDYRYDETLTVETFQFGANCLACHAPYNTPGDNKPKIADVSAVGSDCHNGHLEEGATEFEAGNTVRHPTKDRHGPDQPPTAVGTGTSKRQDKLAVEWLSSSLNDLRLEPSEGCG